MVSIADIKKNLTVSHVVIVILSILLLNAWFLHYGGMGGGSDTSDLEQQISDLNKEKDRLQNGWNTANETAPAADCDCGDKEFNQTELDAAIETATADIQSDLNDCQNETGGSAEIGTFTDEETKDWIDGKLSLKDTAVKTFVPFESADEALEFIKEVYPYNTAHKLSWNNEEANFALADEYKSDRDEVKMLFSAKNNILYAVVPSEDNVVIPMIYKVVEEDDDWAVEEFDGSEIAVVAMDKLEKSSNDD